MSTPPSHSVALVVGAGGPSGGPFIDAALSRLEELTGWVASSATQIVGTSAGAFVAARVDSKPTATTSEQFALLSELGNGALYPSRVRHRIATEIRRAGGLALAVVAPMSRPVDQYRVSPSPFHPGAHVVTVVWRRGRRSVWQLTSVEDPAVVVRASAAIPGVNRPVEIGKTPHIDGAVHSAANVDVVSDGDHDGIVVIAPMVPSQGGPIIGRLHRAQLRNELRPWLAAGKPAVLIMPNEAEHTARRDRSLFERAGVDAVDRLTNVCQKSRDNGHMEG